MGKVAKDVNDKTKLKLIIFYTHLLTLNPQTVFAD